MTLITNNCWSKIGITGDKSCPKLTEVIHCRNCSVYSSVGRTLFQREAPAGYLEEWTNLLAQSELEDATTFNQSDVLSKKYIPSKEASISVIIFRLEEEWFGLPVEIIKEITPIFPVHTLPHRSNHILKGIVNIRGEILLCISLTHLLELKRINKNHKKYSLKLSNKSVIYSRMIVMEIQGHSWVFQADELDNVYQFYPNDFHDSPSSLSKNTDIYTQKIIIDRHKKINYLDSELLFYELLFYTYSRPQKQIKNS